MNMKTILLTGAQGYLARHLIPVLLEQQYTVIGLCRRQTDSPVATNLILYDTQTQRLEDIFCRHTIDVIIHTATCYGRTNETCLDVVKTNLLFPLELMTLAIKHHVPVFINTDSILVKNINPYALSKNQLVDWMHLFEGKIQLINIKLDHFYGPNDNPIKFVAWLNRELKNQTPYINLTEGSQIRNFVYIKDVVSAYLCVLTHLSQLSTEKVNHFEIAGPESVSIRQFALLLKKLLHNTTTSLNFGALPYRKHEVLHYEVDTSALKQLGWSPRYNLESGLSEMIEEEGTI